jgi:hypothetical protein
MCFGRVISSWSTSGTRGVADIMNVGFLNNNKDQSIEKTKPKSYPIVSVQQQSVFKI